MADDKSEDRGILREIADKVKHAGHGLESDLENLAAAMPAAGADMSWAGRSTTTPPPSAGEAAGGALTDTVPVGEADERNEDIPD